MRVLSAERAFRFLNKAEIFETVVKVSAVKGGFLHRLFRVETDKNVYALKVLNAEIMTRSEAFERFVLSEKFARFLKNRGLSVVAAVGKNDTVVFQDEDSFYMIFAWVNGETLAPENVGGGHCAQIGRILYKMHTAGFNPSPTDETVVFSHRDADLKNILWQGTKPFVIDCEAAGYIKPIQELLETAVSFSGFRACRFRSDLFAAVLRGYGQKSAVSNEKMIESYDGMLRSTHEWLTYNEKRAQSDNSAEARTGRAAIAETSLFLKYCKAESGRLFETWKKIREAFD